MSLRRRGDGTVRVGLIGFGLAGAVFHAPLIAAVPRLRLVSIVTRHPERREQARAGYEDAVLLDSAEDLWAARGDHDLVVVATPNRHHVPFGLAAVDAGLHVVVDKPLAASAAEGRRLADAARAGGRMASVFQNRRWDGDFLTLRRLLAESALGRVTRFESRFERWKPDRPGDAWREGADPDEAGGLLFDLGSHLVDQAVQLFGAPTEVYAEREMRRQGAEVDDDVFVALRHAGGVRSHLWMSAVAASLGPRFRVLGMSGAFEKYGLDPQEARLADGEDPTAPDWGREPAEDWGILSDGSSVVPVETEPGAYHGYYEGVAAAILDGAPPPVDIAESIEVLAILEAAKQSAMTGGVVPHRPTA